METISWYKFALTRSEIIDGKEEQMLNEFQKLLVVMQVPDSVSLLCLRNTRSEPVIHFVSIKDDNVFHKKLIEHFVKKQSGVPCKPPQEDSVSLLLGCCPMNLLDSE